MSTEEALQIFERVADSRGQLLRAEGDRLGALPTRLLLTFDVGRILLEPRSKGVVATLVADPKALPGGFIPLDEEEPWWRLLGNPLTAVAPIGDGSGVQLRFRAENANPKVVTLASKGTNLSVSVADAFAS